MKKLSAVSLHSLPEGVHPDHVVTGMKLRVGKKRATWQLRYKKGDQQPTQTIGYFTPHAPAGTDGSLTLAEAREAAKDFLNRLESGAPVVVAKPTHPKDALTVAKALDGYEKMRLKEGKRIKSLGEAMRTMRNNFAKYENTPLRGFTRAEMRELRDEIDKRAPTLANRFLAYCGPFFKWCEDEELIDQNPLYRVRKLAKEAKRERTLSSDELARVWHACGNFEAGGDSGKAFSRLVRFLTATCQRKMEAGNLRHGSILAGHWRQKAEDNKSGREHRLKLPPLALAQVGQGTADQLVFASPNGNVLQNFDRLLKKLHEASGTSGWTLHDLRRSGATRMQELGIARDTIDAVLNHSIAGVAGVYMVSTMDKLKSDALAVWDAELSKIISGANMSKKA